MRALVAAEARTRADPTWWVAVAIHQRCCAHTACAGAFVHLQEAAVAVEALRTPPTHRQPAAGHRAAA